MTIATHDMAIRSLERSLVAMPLGGPDARPFAEHARSRARGLGELGVLTGDEQAEWNERFERAASPSLPAREELRGRARQLLEQELVAGSHRTENLLERRERFIDTLRTLLEIGVVDWREERGWMERLDEAIAPATIPPPATLCDASELRAVALGPPDRLAGLRITSAELFADSVVIRWHLVIDEDPDWRARVFIGDHGCDLAEARGPAALTDDVKTSYVMTPINTWDLDWLRLRQTPEVLPGSSVFVPHVPAHANRLRVGSPAGSFEIDLGTAC